MPFSIVFQQWPVHLSLFSWSSFKQYSTQYSFQATGCFPTEPSFADNKTNIAEMMISLYDRIENIVGTGENAGYQHFLPFPQCF